MRTRHAGVALITALLVVALATMAAAAVLTTADLTIHRTAALRDTEQAWWVAKGVDSWILGLLQQDAEDSDHDGFEENWAQPVDYLPVDQGFISGRVVDQQGRFNLNNLASPQAPQLYQEQFERLLAALEGIEIPPGLVTAIRDWLDADMNPGFPGGAEDTEYLNRDPPYRAGNRIFTSVSELRAVQGVTPELYRALTRCVEDDETGRVESCVTALPQVTPVNVNTAPAPVLRAMSERVNENNLSEFLRRRVEEPYTTIEEFIQADIIAVDARNRAMLSVNSRYFRVEGQVVVGSSRVSLYSLIHRPDPGIPTVLAHSAGED